jgi:hypothetical protein
MVRGVREYRDDFRAATDRSRVEERSDSRREDQRREEMLRDQEESDRQRREDERKADAFRTVLNEDSITITKEDLELINDPSIKMMEDGTIVKKAESIPRSRQFSRANIVGGINLEKPKRTRKKTKTDKKMSKALRLANEKFRKNNGELRKGATQGKIMKYAHKLLKSMK